MQRSWREDEDKLTFIILSKDLFLSRVPEVSSSLFPNLFQTEAMIGDVNLFINHEEKAAEAEVMIAEPAARGKGAAAEAIKLIFSYALQTIDIVKYVPVNIIFLFRLFAKITDDNEASLHLFQDKLGFERVSHSAAFHEYTLELPQEKVSLFKGYLTTIQLESYR